MADRILEVLFPRCCAGCGRGPWPFCDPCRSALLPLVPPWCERCGRPSARPVDSCRDCPPSPITGARAPFAFEGPARRAIHRLKFSGWRGVGDALAAAIVAQGASEADIVTWVPLGRRRLAERGYDQARVLAAAVAERCGIPCRGLLRRTVTTDPQSQRSGAERRTALHGAFEPVSAVPARVLLVDDVLTTGATAAACAGALRGAGAGQVHLRTAARSFHDPRRAPAGGGSRRPVGRAYTQPGSRPGLWLPGDHPR